ncbi:MAG: hypothetical protein ABIT76_00035 [Chthoniobacterales bacterium]
MAKNAPDFAAWTVTTTPVSTSNQSQQGNQASGQGDESKNQPPSRRVMQVVKTGDVRFVRIVEGGSKSERWCKGAFQVIKRPEWRELLLSTGENRADPAWLDFGGGDFAGFDWISAQNFIGIQKVGDRNCLVFKGEIQPGNFQSKRVFFGLDGKQENTKIPEPEKVAVVAYTDFETRLPVALMMDKDSTIYQFGPPPTAMLSMPPEFQSAMDGYAKQMQLLLRRPSRP